MQWEGAVWLAARKKLMAIEDTAERSLLFHSLVDAAYKSGRVEACAARFEVESVIDPGETRSHISTLLRACTPLCENIHRQKSSRFIDPW
jgi:acetyl-CoA carboxylase carboxyltransferase component